MSALIAKWRRAWMRLLLQVEINGCEDDLVSLSRQRMNDIEAEHMIREELSIAKRRMRALIQAEINQKSDDSLIRRIKL